MTDDDSPEPHAAEPAPQSAFDCRINQRVSSLEDSRQTWRWILGLAAPAIIAVMLWAADKVQSSAEHLGESRATIEGFKRTLDTLDQDIRELRSKILKLSGADPAPGISIVAR